MTMVKQFWKKSVERWDAFMYQCWIPQTYTKHPPDVMPNPIHELKCKIEELEKRLEALETAKCQTGHPPTTS